MGHGHKSVAPIYIAQNPFIKMQQQPFHPQQLYLSNGTMLIPVQTATPITLADKSKSEEIFKEKNRTHNPLQQMHQNVQRLHQHLSDTCSVTSDDMSEGCADSPKIKKYYCRVDPNCKKVFGDASTRTRHEKVHSSIRYPCARCGTEYSRKDNRNRHEQKCTATKSRSNKKINKATKSGMPLKDRKTIINNTAFLDLARKATAVAAATTKGNDNNNVNDNNNNNNNNNMNNDNKNSNILNIHNSNFHDINNDVFLPSSSSNKLTALEIMSKIATKKRAVFLDKLQDKLQGASSKLHEFAMIATFANDYQSTPPSRSISRSCSGSTPIAAL